MAARRPDRLPRSYPGQSKLCAARIIAAVAGLNFRPGTWAIEMVRVTSGSTSGRCMCLFEADSESDVKRLNDDAGLPYNQVVEALDLTP